MSFLPKSYDIIIVGAGPSGSTCATLLARGGAHVLLLEKSSFPRDKTCGDFISARLKDNLEKSNLCPPLKGTHPGAVSDLLFSHPKAGSFTLSRPPAQGFICKRKAFDHLLFEQAQAKVDGLTNMPVKKLLFEGKQIVGVQTADQTFRAKIVVGADGANGITARALGVPTFDENHNAVAIRAYYNQIEGIGDTAELHFLDEVQPGYFWIFPLNPATGEANVGLGLLSRQVRYGNVQLKQLLERIIATHPLFAQRFCRSECLSPIKGWSLPFGSKKRPVAFPGAVLLGDAAGLIDPMSGEGIENGIRSAQCAAPVLLQSLAAGNYSKEFLMQYQRNLEDLLRNELRQSYWIQKLCRNKIMLKGFFKVLQHSERARKVLADKFF